MNRKSHSGQSQSQTHSPSHSQRSRSPSGSKSEQEMEIPAPKSVPTPPQAPAIIFNPPKDNTPKFQIANPGPLGLTGFATTTFALSIINANLLPKTIEPVIASMAYFHGGTVQLIAGILELLCNNIFGGTAFMSYGAFWISFSHYVTAVSTTIDAAYRYQAVGLFLLAWTFLTTVLLIASFRAPTALTLLFLPLEVTFILLTIGTFTQVGSVVIAGGWFGIITAMVAYYIALAGLLNTMWDSVILPIDKTDISKLKCLGKADHLQT